MTLTIHPWASDADGYGLAFEITDTGPGETPSASVTYYLDDRQMVDLAVALRGEWLRSLTPDLRVEADSRIRRIDMRHTRMARKRRRGWA